MSRLRHLVFFCLICLFSVSSSAQDPIFSQFYAAHLQLNPAFTGNTIGPYVSLIYRNQWPSLNKAYVTYAASVDKFVPYLNSGFGIMVQADDAGQGLLKTNKISGLYSYRVKVNDDFFLKLAAEGSVIQSTVNWDELVFFDQIDDINGPISPGGTPYPSGETRPEDLTKTYFDFSAGLLAYGKVFYGGVGLKHLNTPDEAFIGVNETLYGGLPLRLTIHGGAEIQLTRGNKRREASFISPNIMLIKQGDFGQVNVGAYGNLGMIFAGAWYRHAFTNSDAAILLLGVKKGVIKIGYSYDITLSPLASISGGTGGSHEVSLTLNFDKPRTPDYNDCFQMFR